MKRVEIFNLLAMCLTLWAIVPKIEGQVRPIALTNPRPLCSSQFALVNYACGRLPFTPGAPPGPPPTPPSPDDDGGGDDGGNDKGHRNHHHNHGNGHGHGRGHGHNHRHGHRHSRAHTQEEENCCRWAREVDSQCVCELLVRLPPFLVRPLHIYTLTIGEDCQITYSCGGPI